MTEHHHGNNLEPESYYMILPMIELIFDRDCPNAEPCRAVLRSALAEAGMPQSWREWDRNASETPAEYRAFGSPTLLVDGRDISAAPGAASATGNSCRVYVDEASGRLRGTPSVQSIVSEIASRRSA